LLSHDAVGECAVVGQLDEAGLMKTKGFVVLNGGHQPSPELEQEMIAHVANHIASFKAPTWIVFTDELPKTATGKIRRFQLREGE